MKKGKMIKKETKQRGITLVALVVTIIIMLILAGVTLSIALGENGLFKMTRSAVNKYEQSSINEQKEIESVIESIKELEAIDGDEINSNPKKYYGQYVNYAVDLNGDKDYTNDWRLFYVGGTDKDDSDEVKGRIYIIAADYVPMSHEALSGVVAEEGSSTGMRPATNSGYGALSAYWPSAPSSFQTPVQNTEEDQTQISVSKLFMHEGYDLSKNETKNNSKYVSTLLNTDNWSKFVNKSNYGEVAIGGPTVEMWCKAWNAVVDEADGFRKIYPNGKGSSGYYVGENATQTSTYFYYITKSGSGFSTTEKSTIEKNYNVFFPQTGYTNVTANGVTGNCYGYWLASPSAHSASDVVYVNYYGYVYYYSFNSISGAGLRPAVCLQSGVKLQKNTAKSDDTKTVYDIVK